MKKEVQNYIMSLIGTDLEIMADHLLEVNNSRLTQEQKKEVVDMTSDRLRLVAEVLRLTN